ncbi:hypothetical protein LUZ61_010177 [Rhynchospora tenuis]|uniref:Uncharacterized protein n=1 Tax=Rhynchospora tenuis TaxID=198213 RepID=A0AAD5ZYK1_9POAL|nr:hypothetical protein LUZ61_010177 [Rhynchospora tenuis]
MTIFSIAIFPFSSVPFHFPKSNIMSPTESTSNNNHSKPPNLNPSSLLSPPPTSLSHFSDSIDCLAASISSSSTPTDSSSSFSSRDAYLDSTISLLNTCNTISARIEQLRLGCLRLKYAHHLLSSPSDDHLSCATKALSEWEVLSNDANSDLDLSSVEEVEKAKMAVRKLREAIDKSEIDGVELRLAAVEMEKFAEELTASLDRLAAAVNKLLTVVMGSRNEVLDSCKVGPKSCK